MILAAGLGTRLLPITKEIPKPLVNVLNVPNILHSLYLLHRSGIKEVILNLHHLPEQLETFLGDGSRWGMHLEYSREKTLLGTGGGVKKAAPFFGKDRFVLVNCDFVADVELRLLIERHINHNALGTMVLYQHPEKEKLYSRVGVDGNGRLCSLPRLETKAPAQTGIFTGIHILEAETLACLEENPCGINEILYPHLMKEEPDRVFGDFTKAGYWYDTGDLPALLCATTGLLDALAAGDPMMTGIMRAWGGYEEKRKGVWMPAGERLPQGVEIVAPAVIGRDCQFGKQVKLGPHVVLDDNSVVGDKARLSKFLGIKNPRIASNEVSEGVIQYHQSKLTD